MSIELAKPMGRASPRAARQLRATYRLQFHEHFRLRDALALVPYFHALGISHIYASPLFKARAHSVHGYDVCDYSQLNPEIGTEAELEKFVNALHERRMGLILDIVPNHMGIGTQENVWWWDVLKNGHASKFANHFDINWHPPDPKLQGKILVPVLGDTLENVFAKYELQLHTKGGEFFLSYYDHTFPVAPKSIPEDFSLRTLLERQHYVLAPHWEGDEKLNYRRFFAVSTLAAVRVEDERVFNDVHALLHKWIERGWIDGLRVDHPDGLREPKKYLERLRNIAPDLWIIVEKILQPKEEIPNDWPVQGTVGYDFLNQTNGLFIDSKNKDALINFYSEFTGETTDACKSVQEKKVLVLKTLFTTEVNRLVEMLRQISVKHAVYQKFSREQFQEALIEFAASFSVYRTYVRPEENFINEDDCCYIKEAAAKAKKLRADLPAELFEFLSGLMLLRFCGDLEDEFVARFQQLTSPAMAKGVEDTAFYCLNWFASINEVGGDPGKFGVSAEEFHEFCRAQQSHWPASMLCSSTHDTKKSEDVRGRMNVLSEIPDKWRETVFRWSKTNERHRQNNFPDRNMEYLFYQTLVGVWPISIERVYAYMEKASCEAKQHTDWNHRNVKYDEALKGFIEKTLADKNFTDDLEKFISSLTEAAQIASLAQTLIKLTAPGVPDIYQGNEIWDFSLVDPDNRRLVDYEVRKQLLAETKNLSPEEIWNRRDSGLPKLFLIKKTLGVRKEMANAFNGNYEPLMADNIMAFMRGGEIITVTPQFIQSGTGFQPVFSDRQDACPTIKLPLGNWRDEFSGDNFSGEIAVANLFQKFPVALLVKGV